MQEEFEPIDLNPKATNTRKIIIAVTCVLLVVILAVTAALLVKRYVIETFIVDGVSMYPTLDGGNGPYHESGSDNSLRLNGETLYLNKVAKIKRGDIVVFDRPDDWSLSATALVKRVIAVGGDHVQIIDNEVYVNGEKLEENYIYEPMITDDLDVWVEEGKIFCMGDNRNNSSDCRHHPSLVPLDKVRGKCFLIKSMKGKLRVCK